MVAPTISPAEHGRSAGGSGPVSVLQRARALAVVAIVVIVLAAVPFAAGLNVVSLLTQGFIYGALAVSLDLVWGYTGILDLGHALWFGIGALAVGIASSTVASTGQVTAVDGTLAPHLIGLVVGAVAAAALAGLVSLVAFTGRGQTAYYIGIVTLALSVVAGTLVMQFDSFTGGEAGLYGFGLASLTPVNGYWFSLTVLVVFGVLAFVIVRSDFGVLMRAVRDQERRVGFFGFSVPVVKTITFVGGAVLAAISGAVYGWVIGLVSPSSFGFLMATNIVIWVAIGGRASIFGPIIGTAVITIAQAQLNASAPQLWELLVGAIFVVVIVFLPHGIIAPVIRLGRTLPGFRYSASGRQLVAAAELEPGEPQDDRPLVSLEHLNFGYGQRRVLSDLNLEVRAGELLAIVGPNGAGKSTLFTVLADGRHRYEGTIRFDRDDLVHRRKAPHLLLRAGIARKFQTPDLFPTLTAAETIMLAVRRGRFPSMLSRSSRIAVPQATLDIVSAMGLDQHLNTETGQLAHGLRQGLEIAAMIATRPKVMLLDEPTAGLTSAEREVVGDILTRLVQEQGIALVLIEHDLDFVIRIADQVAVLARGSVLENGPPEDVAQSPVVREVYTGEAGILWRSTSRWTT